MKLGLVIASHGRPDILKQVLGHLMSSQARIPDTIVISAVSEADIPDLSPTLKIKTVLGSAGLTRQRNRGISFLIDEMDLIAFIDDDFIVGDDYFFKMEKIFEKDDLIIGLNGEVIADGANSPGLTFDEGLRLAQQYRTRQKLSPYTRDIRGTYGCNMAFRSSRIGSVRFDERLALYGWQEDLDFCGGLRGCGRIVQSNLIWGVHLGTKRGKGSEVRLGYSQIINPAYIVKKGNMSFWYAFQLASKNFLANLVKSIRPESYVDRRGRLRGNMIGMFHLLTGRLTPEYILDLK